MKKFSNILQLLVLKEIQKCLEILFPFSVLLLNLSFDFVRHFLYHLQNSLLSFLSLLSLLLDSINTNPNLMVNLSENILIPLSPLLGLIRNHVLNPGHIVLKRCFQLFNALIPIPRLNRERLPNCYELVLNMLN